MATVEAQAEAGSVNRAALTGNTGAAFLLVGLCGASIGPSLPQLTAGWGVSLGEGGILFTVNFASGAVTIALAGLLLTRLGLRGLLSMGGLLVGLGTVGLAMSPGLGLAILAMTLFGLGGGGLNLGLNLLAADLFPHNRRTALNLLNGVWGVGAVLAPLLIGLTSRAAGSLPYLLAAFGGLMAVAGLVFLLMPAPPRPVVATQVAPGEQAIPTRRGLLRSGAVWRLTLFFFLYIGTEVGFSGWLYSFATREGLTTAVAALVVTTFWLAFTAGRFGGGLAARLAPGLNLIVAGAGLTMGGSILFAAFGTQTWAAFVGAALAGLGLGPIFPTAFAALSDRFGTAAGAVASMVMLAASLGGAVLPYVQGQLLAGFGVPVALGCITLGLAVAVAMQLTLPATDVETWGTRKVAATEL